MMEFDLKQLVLAQNELLMEILRRLDKLEKQPQIIRQFLTGGRKTTTFADLLDTIADTQTPNTLLLDGSRQMTGSIIPDSDNAYDCGGAYPNRWRYVRCVWIQPEYYKAQSTTSYFKARAVASGKVNFQTTYGGDLNVAVLETLGSGTGQFSIPKAGDIAFLTGKVLSGLGDVRAPDLPLADPSDGLSKLWSNGGVVTVGT